MKIASKVAILSFSLAAMLLACQSDNATPISAGSWTWESGADTLGQQGAYGIKGTADPSNAPGARDGAVSWIDADGQFWLFGGRGANSFATYLLNDLWKFNPGTLQWTWVSGSDLPYQSGIYGTRGSRDPSNVPGAREASASWRDSQGNFWLFGGFGQDGAGNDGWLNDLWKFDPITLEWAWISGSDTVDQPGSYGTKGAAAPSNVPGAREGTVSWIDAGGRLWLFGGHSLVQSADCYFNDLWKYDPTSREWSWVSGSNANDQHGTYGSRSVADPSNVPGARRGAVSWVDASGRVWLFGGLGYDSTGDATGSLNDLWKFDPTTLEWTWVSGQRIHGQNGVYGARGLAAPSNVPGGRDSPVSWIDAGGSLWLFGGSGHDSAGNAGTLNDLWRFDPSTSEWTWVTGGKIYYENSVYGTRGTAAASNIPGARSRAVSQIDSTGAVWLFGGVAAYLVIWTQAEFNDLWRYER